MTNLSARAVNIVLKPKSEWLIIKREHSTYKDVIGRYVAILTLLPTLAITLPVIIQFMKYSSEAVFYRNAALHAGLLGVQLYLINIINVLIIGEVFQLFFRIYGSINDKVWGLKIAAYSLTPLWITISLTAIPHVFFDWFSLLGVLYALYLMYWGIVIVIGIPQKKAFLYSAGSILVSVLILGLVDTVLFQFIDYVNKVLSKA